MILLKIMGVRRNKKVLQDGSYFIYDEYEIHLNRIAAGSVQEWHYHSQIEETLLITKGEITAYWLDNGIKRSRKVGKNEIVRVGNSTHTFANETDSETEFAVFRFVPNHVDRKEIIICGSRDMIVP